MLVCCCIVVLSHLNSGASETQSGKPSSSYCHAGYACGDENKCLESPVSLDTATIIIGVLLPAALIVSGISYLKAIKRKGDMIESHMKGHAQKHAVGFTEPGDDKTVQHVGSDVQTTPTTANSAESAPSSSSPGRKSPTEVFSDVMNQ